MCTSASQTKRPGDRLRWWQYSLSTLFLVMAVAAAIAWCFAPNRGIGNYVERDLALELKVLGDGNTVRFGQEESFELALINRSSRRTHFIPDYLLLFIYCEAKYRTQSGEWVDVPPRGFWDGFPFAAAGGSMHDYYVEHDLFEFERGYVVGPGDVMLLYPGDRISTPIPSPWGWNLPAFPAKLRLRFHCVYYADKLEVELPMMPMKIADGRLTYKPTGLEPLIVGMQHVPSFHLVSPWVEFTMVLRR